MTKLEQDSLEIIQEFLPRIAVALEKIATQNNGEKQCTSKSQKPTA